VDEDETVCSGICCFIVDIVVGVVLIWLLVWDVWIVVSIGVYRDRRCCLLGAKNSLLTSKSTEEELIRFPMNPCRNVDDSCFRIPWIRVGCFLPSQKITPISGNSRRNKMKSACFVIFCQQWKNSNGDLMKSSLWFAVWKW
jgi:hypothetical protein